MPCVPVPCPARGRQQWKTAGTCGASPRTFTAVSIGGWRAADAAKATSAEDVIGMRHAGTLTSASVYVQTRGGYTGSPTVELVAPDGTRSALQRTGASHYGQWAAYSTASSPPSSLIGKAVEGDWKVVAGAPASSLLRTSMSLSYTATCPAVLPTVPAPTTPDPPTPNPTTPDPPTPGPYTVYVANTDAREIRTYLPDGTSSGTFVAAGGGGLGRPWSVVFGSDGHLYVSDHSGSAIRRYNGSTGLPMGSGSDAATDSLWARTLSRPYGMAWNGETLHVATYGGIERFSLAGTSLGTFGQASRTPTGDAPAAASLAYPYDVAFGGDRMYVADRGNDRIAYYSASTGKYLGAVSSRTSAFTTVEPSGLAWRGSLYQSGGDAGQVNRIATPALTLERSFSGTHIDEPFGMDVAHDGSVYVASKDTGRVAVISAAGVVTRLVSSSLDDPRDVAVGPRYAPALTPGAAGASGASGAGGAAGGQGAQNSEPELEVLVGGRPAGPVVDLAASTGTAGVSVRATDAEGNAVSISMAVLETALAGGATPASPPALTDHGNGTATLTVDGSTPGEYLVELSASDAHGEEWDTYIIRVAPAAGPS